MKKWQLHDGNVKCGCLFLGIFGSHIAGPCNIIHGHIIKSGQNHNVVNRNPDLSGFIVCISPLAHMKQVSYLLLCQETFLPDFPDSLIVFHILHLLKARLAAALD